MPLSQFDEASSTLDTTLFCPESREYLEGLFSLEDKSRSENLPKF